MSRRKRSRPSRNATAPNIARRAEWERLGRLNATSDTAVLERNRKRARARAKRAKLPLAQQLALPRSVPREELE